MADSSATREAMDTNAGSTRTHGSAPLDVVTP